LSDSLLPSQRKSRWLDWAGPAAFFIGLALLWQRLNQGPSQWDDSWYLTDSLNLVDALRKWGIGGWVRCYLFEVQVRFRAPLMCALPTPIYLLFGRNANLAFAVNYLFILLLFWSVHAITERYWGRRAALLAVFITGSMTELFVLTNWYFVEYGMAALAVASIWCLIQSENLTRTRWVVLFSIVAGLGALQKIIYPVYVGPMFAWFLVRRVMGRKRAGSPSMMTTVAALVLPAAVIAGPWYVTNFGIAVGHAFFSGFSKKEADLYGTGDPYTLAAVRKYLFMVINEGIGAAYLCVAAIAGAVWIGLRCAGRKLGTGKENCQGKLVLVLWALPFLIFLFGHNKQVRFIAPILPIFAIVLGIVLSGIIEALGRRGWVVVGVMLAGALGFLIQLCFEPLGARKVDLWCHPGRLGDNTNGLHFLDPGLAKARMYEPKPWPLRETLEEVIALRARQPAKIYHVMVGSDSFHFNYNNLQLAAAQGRLSVDVRTSAYYDDPVLLRDDLRGMDFFLVRQGGENPDPKYDKFLGVGLDEIKTDGMFQLTVSDISYPDQGVLWIYQKRASGPVH
jgi:hypothetical protein